MKKLSFSAGAIILITLLFSFTVSGQERQIASFLPDWAISGQNSLYVGFYDSGGPQGSYYSKGLRSYNDVNIQFQNTANPYNTMKGYISGTINDSPYRANRYGVILERFNFNQENGNVPVPYRLDVGDFYAFITPRTLQRSLKGGQIEFQPGKAFGAAHSLLFQYGFAAQDYMEDISKNSYGSASWMMNVKNTRFAINYVYNKQEAQYERPTLNQHVWGAALNHRLALFSQDLNLDAEWNTVRADQYANDTKIITRGNGFFVQIQGRSTLQMLPITYSSRFEEYGPRYLVTGSSVTTGRRIFDNRVAWQSKTGYTLSGRAQFYKDGVGTDTSTNTDVLGIGMSGVIPNPFSLKLTGNLDAFRQTATSHLTKTINDSINANVNVPLSTIWNARLSGSMQDTDVKRGTTTDSRNEQIGLDISRTISIWDFNGTATGGVTYYKIYQRKNDSRNIGFNFSSNLGKNNTRINFNYRFLRIAHYNTSNNRVTHGANLGVEHRYGRNLFRFEADHGTYLSHIDPNSRDTRMSFTWTFNFEKPAEKKKVSIPIQPAEEKKYTMPEAPVKIQTFSDLAPNLPLQQVLAGLAEKGVKGGIEESNHIIFETVWFPEITQRQRLVLVKKANRLEKAVLIIDLQQVGEHETMRELYSRIQGMLSRDFGAAVTREKGVFGPNIAADLRNGNFLRTSDWSTPTGVLRLGIPYRIDGIVRIEIQHAESFPLSSHVNWGLEEVR